MNRVMLDLETMGNGADAAIIAIGAVRFNVTDGVLDEFYVIVDLESSVAAGLKLDVSTVLWWMEQNDIARGQITQPGTPLKVALSRFASWVGEGAEVWGNGAAFDNVILSNAFRMCKLERPWSYRNDRCYRTLKALYPGIKLDRFGVAHCAVDDARSQAAHLIEILKQLEPST